MSTPVQESPQAKLARLQHELQAATQEAANAPMEVKPHVIETAVKDGCVYCQQELATFFDTVARHLGLTVPSHGPAHDEANAEANAQESPDPGDSFTPPSLTLA